MNKDMLLREGSVWQRRFRIIFLLILIVAITAAHWWTPRESHFLHTFHIIFRKLYFLVVVIAALSGVLVRFEKQALQDVAETHEGSLLALVAALDTREHDTELHSLRVRA